jgi:thiopeptide-type bacteriocin biosynthesis protein
MHFNLEKGLIRIPLLGLNHIEELRLTDLSSDTIIKALKLLCGPEIIEALYISSPDFMKVIENIISGSEQVLSYSKLLEIWITFVKYYTRMCSRGTPFGLMASVGVISLGKQSTIQQDIDGYIHVQLDNDIVSQLALVLEHSEQLKGQLEFFPNPSIYKQANNLKYFEVTNRVGQKEFALSKVERNGVVRKILAFCKPGKRIPEVVDYLQEKFPDVYETGDLNEFIADLIANQLLLSNLSSSSTKTTLFAKMVKQLEELSNKYEKAGEIITVDRLLNKIKRQNWTTNKEVLAGIENNLKLLECLGNGSPMYHVNFMRSFSKSSINSNVFEKVREVVELIGSVNENYKSDNIEAFKAAFSQRYENRYIPLSEILDEEIGIGYPVGNIRNSSLDGCFENINLQNKDSAPQPDALFNPFYVFLLNKITALNSEYSKVLELTSADLKPFSTNNTKLPPTFSIFCNILAQNSEKIDQGEFDIIISNSSYTSASSPINRFSVSDQEIERLCMEIFEEEKKIFSDKIVAEVLHSPNSRIENIAFRKVTREYEIPVESISTNELDRQIYLDDILVNVINNQVKLFSRKENKEIIPRISNSHSFNHPNFLPAYQFLGELQLQKQQNFFLWRWGALGNLNFLPRVVINKNVIVSLATWRVTLEKSFFNDSERLPEKLKDKLTGLGLPKNVSLRQNNDNLLIIDTEDETCLLMLLKEFKKFPFLIFHEYLSTVKNSFIKDLKGNSYINELIIPFIEKKSIENITPIKTKKPRKKESREKRFFFPGEEYLYVKIYCTRNIGQLILLQSLSSLLFEDANDNSTVFFIRYEDPEAHIRVRIRKENNETILLKIYKSLQKFIDNKFIYRIQTDTYIRELDRYFAISYDKTERIFAEDSKGILKVLKFLNKSKFEPVTWIIAVKNIFNYLRNFGLDDDEMLHFCHTTRTDFFKELKLDDKEFLKSLNLKLKNDYKLMSAIIAEFEPNFHAIYQILSLRDRNISEIVSDNEKKRIKSSHAQLFSYIHMSINRLFASDQRFKEAISYDLLYNFLLGQKKGYHKLHLK